MINEEVVLILTILMGSPEGTLTTQTEIQRFHWYRECENAAKVVRAQLEKTPNVVQSYCLSVAPLATQGVTIDPPSEDASPFNPSKP